MLGMNRRFFLLGALAAPAVIRTPGLLMPVKPLPKAVGYTVANRLSYTVGEIVCINRTPIPFRFKWVSGNTFRHSEAEIRVLQAYTPEPGDTFRLRLPA